MRRANDGAVMRMLSKAREMFAELDARDRCGNRLERTADFGRGRRLHIPHVEMARPAIKENQDAGIGGGGQRRPLSLLLGADELWAVDAEQPQTADVQHSALGK